MKKRSEEGSGGVMGEKGGSKGGREDVKDKYVCPIPCDLSVMTLS